MSHLSLPLTRSWGNQKIGEAKRGKLKGSASERMEGQRDVMKIFINKTVPGECWRGTLGRGGENL